MTPSSKSISNNASANGAAAPLGQRPVMRVAFQGDHGAYAEHAISEIWRHPVERIPVRTFAAAVRAVHDGEADACVVPVENSIVGRVEQGWRALGAHKGLRTVREVVVPVQHCLLGLRGATLQDLRVAHSHPVALAGCAKFFEAHQWIKPGKS
ncbi:MAG TPA: prephenate dehydratase domain-containing protein, partial [Gemmatimonadaceae bacterium]|nr:prephenate dehydratase domain-containing protein [Gemmatimonadaceae bacterium]